ncbi:MAG: MFS transporter [Proteobacteria bacterium]|nr:MFS transporter [Pseudomonadota bacterium]MBU0967628.1 MFS transporter [Pseudomonadota bacterium]
MAVPSSFRLPLIVFALVSSSFTNIYITQPVLPVLQHEFAADMVLVSFTVSVVILGIAIANLPFGLLADRIAIQPIIAVGGLMVAAGGFVCAVTYNLWILIGARFVQGIFIPALTTCLAAYLAKTLPSERLNVVMGSSSRHLYKTCYPKPSGPRHMQIPLAVPGFFTGSLEFSDLSQIGLATINFTL